MGTAAAEGWPGIWCRCAFCQEARRRGGKDIRTRAGAVIDGLYKIDFGPDTYMQALRDGIDLGAVEHLLVTHTHEDHFLTHDLPMRGKPYAHGVEHSLTIWAGDNALAMVRPVQKTYATPNITLKHIRPFVPFQAGDATVTPLLADHNPIETCFVFAFERGGRRLLWGHDSGIFPAETWEYMQGQAPFDVVVLDGTNGSLPWKEGHLGVDGMLEVQEMMRSRGIARPDTVFVANHFSHNGGLLHAELEEKLCPHGFLVAYDGMRLMI